MFPDHPLKETQSNGERKVFYALREGLPPAYTVIQSVPIYYRANHRGSLLPGEADFLIVHPDKGLIVIEVKGGGISINSANRQWRSTDSKGNEHDIKDPYEQAKKYSYRIADELKNAQTTRRYDFPFTFGVWFPDIDTSRTSLGISTHLSDLTLDERDLEYPENAASRLYRNLHGDCPRKGPGREGVEALGRHFAPSWNIGVRLSSRFKQEEATILQATRMQYKVLSLLQRHSRALICGVAGSGKTLLAMEKARRLAADGGKKVLVVCFNVLLADEIRKTLDDVAGVDVFHFHGLCYSLCREADIPLPQPDPAGGTKDFFDHQLPEFLFDALCKIERRYDALIVDEGQDFSPLWWHPLVEVLADPREGTFYIFFDDNQLIYDHGVKFPIDEEPFSLSENCRNTRQIHESFMKYYRGNTTPESRGPDGRSPLIKNLGPSDDEVAEVKRILNDLFKKDGIDPGDVVILTPRSEGNSVWRTGDRLAGCRLSWRERGGHDTIFCSTIHRFKGLESPVVVVTETHELHPKTKDSLLYVSLSRARNHLIVVNSPGRGVGVGELHSAR